MQPLQPVWCEKEGCFSFFRHNPYGVCGIVQTKSGAWVPNEDIARLWQDDYKFMCEHMIFGLVPSFDELISKLSMLNDRIRQLNYRKA